MFTGIIRVERMTPKQVTQRVVTEINELLRKQRGDARKLTTDSLIAKLSRMVVVAAWNDGDRIVGIGALTLGEGLNFECAEIRHLVLSDHVDSTAVGIRILQELEKVHINANYVDGGAWRQHDGIGKIYEALGYELKDRKVYRKRFKALT